MKKIFVCLVDLLLIMHGFSQQGYVQYVNPFIGTGGHGHTYPGATVPHGMVQLSPDTRLTGWDGCGGYHYSDSFIYGFSHTHLSGTGVSDYGDILLMPMNGQPSPDNKVYGSAFRHEDEKATAGFYSVKLLDNGIQVALSATERAGIHHYSFSSAADNAIILDLAHRDEVIESYLNLVDSVTITGLRRSKSWASNQYVYFVIKFSSPVIKSGIWKDAVLDEQSTYASAKNLKAYFRFNLPATNDMFVKVAISPVNAEGAMRNLEAEIPGWDFETVKSQAEQKWESELSKIEVRSDDTSKLRIFYTALYHTAIVPNIHMDVDGQYRGMDGKIHMAAGFTYYSVFSLWDTYRAAHPLYSIIDRQRTLDYIKTFLVQYQQGGRLPVWELASCETDCMIGYHSVPVITDAYMKGITGFDTRLALEAMKKSANWHHFGLPAYIKSGMMEVDDESESVSKTLEYAYDDWCIAQFAKLTGNEKDYREYSRRSQYYKNILDASSGFMRPRKNGGWLQPFDPREVNNHFTEANSWQYSFYFPQDIKGYLELTGGAKKLEQKLDALFSAPQQTTGRDQSDITGLIGQYAHGNEPSHHIAYLYNYTGKPYKTQQLVNRIMTDMYLDAPDGLIGNEDCGQMSAWYVLSALGFYPVTPGSPYYMIGSPIFPLATINLENEKSFIINAPGAGGKNVYIQQALISTAAKMKPTQWDSAYLKHGDIANGGLITYMMGEKPGKILPIEVKQLAASYTGSLKIVMNPVINGGGVPFKGTKAISISSIEKNVPIYYTTDGTEPTAKSRLYKIPFAINRSMVVKAIAINQKGIKSFVTRAEFRKVPHNWTVKYNAAYEQQYDGGGVEGLIDGLHGTIDWRKGNWQGYQHTDMDVIVDLKSVRPVSKIKIGFLQDTRSWIIMPKQVQIEVSTDGTHYEPLYAGKEFLYIEDEEPQVMILEPSFPVTTARYIRVKAVQYGNMPDWHMGAGGASHIFVDEIEIE